MALGTWAMGLVRAPGYKPRGAVLQAHAQGLYTLVVGAEPHAWVCRPTTYPGLGRSLGTLDLAAAKSMFPWI